jgi:uncharacterized membrane protein
LADKIRQLSKATFGLSGLSLVTHFPDQGNPSPVAFSHRVSALEEWISMTTSQKISMTTSQKVSAWAQYLYFLRFSILSWLFLPLLILLDHLGYTTTITRAFMAPDSPWQAFHIAFFTVSLQMAVLVTARNSCMNGAERFQSPPPLSLGWLFGSSEPRAVWWSLALAHIPTLITLCYVADIARIEGEAGFPFLHYHSSWLIWLYFGIGILAALFFWFAVSLFYHWTYTEPLGNDVEATGAKPLIFPQKFFGDLDSAPRPILGEVLERPLRSLARITYPGFAPGPDGPLWELHFLAFVSLVGFLLLYLFLYPLTAPVPREDDLQAGKIVACIVALLFIAGVVFTPTRGHGKWATPVKYFFVAVAVFLATVFCVSASQFLHGTGTERDLPVLATIVILCSFMLWFFAGLAFLLDRYRIPVLTALLVIIFFPKLMHWTYGEHYFLAEQRIHTDVIPPSPAQALNIRTHDPSDPLVIVTATGGGIHAAAWTTEILGRLEQSFAGDPSLHAPFPGAKAYNFHDHVLLASGVSGGSVGLMSYLLEYTAEKPFDPQHLPAAIARMTNAAACSSIEDVAWGLEYYDFLRLLFNVWLSRSDNAAPDRNWALTKAFNRNLHHPLCRTDDQSLPGLQPLTLDGEHLTLGKGAELLRTDQLPAFTLNTTAVETGGRFLLSNYQIPRNYIPDSDLLPSESFLHAYGEPCADGPLHNEYSYADLPIATAARLSATFPLVSSASRVPAQFAPYAYHFVDGGYYDNDGTASALEFLSSALTKPAANLPQDPCFQSSSAPSTLQSPPLAILLIEIRNGDDLDPLSNVDDYNFQTHPKDKHSWTAISQLSAPPGALWKAGHESVTRRNRLGLCLLETTYLDRLVVHHVVFNYDPAPPSPEAKNPRDEIQPLNWHLTAGERKEITDKAGASDTAAAIEDARNWVRTILNREPANGLRQPVEADQDEACRIAYVRAKP